MASPLKARGAKSLANLKRGGNPPPRKRTAEDEEIRRVSKKLLKDPAYQKTLRRRLRAGTIQPGVESMLYYYAFGKPKEIIEATQVVPVKIVHEYAEEKPPSKKKDGGKNHPA